MVFPSRYGSQEDGILEFLGFFSGLEFGVIVNKITTVVLACYSRGGKRLTVDESVEEGRAKYTCRKKGKYGMKIDYAEREGFYIPCLV